MAGHKTGRQTLVKMKTPEVLWTHCMLHRAALVSKTISEELNNVFARLFAKLCEDMRAKCTSLLYYCEVRWLSRSKVIQRVLELKEEIAMLLEENHNEDGNMFRDDNFIVKLTYLVDISEKLSVLNKSRQGQQMHLLIQKDKVRAFIKKVELWKSNLQNNKIDKFPRLNLCSRDNIEANKNLFVEHLNGLLLQFLILTLQSLRGCRIHLSTKKIMNLD
nr:zinc finger BED domain-containing protein 5-like [Parasteatoda tepidariorum]